MVDYLSALDYLDTVTSDVEIKAEVFGVDDYAQLRNEGYVFSDNQTAQCKVILTVKASLDAVNIPELTPQRWFNSYIPGKTDEGTRLELLAEGDTETRELILNSLPQRNI